MSGGTQGSGMGARAELRRHRRRQRRRAVLAVLAVLLVAAVVVTVVLVRRGGAISTRKALPGGAHCLLVGWAAAPSPC